MPRGWPRKSGRRSMQRTPTRECRHGVRACGRGGSSTKLAREVAHCVWRRLPCGFRRVLHCHARLLAHHSPTICEEPLGQPKRGVVDLLHCRARQHAVVGGATPVFGASDGHVQRYRPSPAPFVNVSRLLRDAHVAIAKEHLPYGRRDAVEGGGLGCLGGCGLSDFEVCRMGRRAGRPGAETIIVPRERRRCCRHQDTRPPSARAWRRSA